MSHDERNRWQRPQLYGTIVALYLFLMSGLAGLALGYTIAVSPSNGVAAFFMILLAPSVPAAVMLWKKEPTPMTKGVVQVALAFWTILEGILFWGLLVNFGDPDLNPPPLRWYLIMVALLAVSGLMWVFLHKRFPRESGRLFNF
jgi:hypothetical protein